MGSSVIALPADVMRNSGPAVAAFPQSDALCAAFTQHRAGTQRVALLNTSG